MRSTLLWLLAIGIGATLFYAVFFHRDARNPPTPATLPHQQGALASELPISHIQRETSGYTIVSADLRQFTLHLFWKTPDGQPVDMLKGVEKLFENQDEKFLFATNAGIFNVKYTPLGLHVENGKTLVPLNLKSGGGNFHLKPNGVFLYDDASGASILESTRYGQLKPNPKIAVQSGPLLVCGNKLHPSLKPNKTSLYIRSAVAVESPWRVHFVISEQPVSLYDIAAVCKEDLKCPDALYLDGAISQFYFPETPPALQRHFAGILAISRRK